MQTVFSKAKYTKKDSVNIMWTLKYLFHILIVPFIAINSQSLKCEESVDIDNFKNIEVKSVVQPNKQLETDVNSILSTINELSISNRNIINEIVDKQVMYAEKLNKNTEQWVSVTQENVHSLIMILIGFMTIIIPVLSVIAPYIFTQRLRNQINELILDVKEKQSSAEEMLFNIKELHLESSEHLDAMREDRALLQSRDLDEEPSRDQIDATKEISEKEVLPLNERLRALGLRFVDERNWNKAEGFFQLLTNLNRDNAEAWYYLGLSKFKQVETLDAKETIRILNEVISHFDASESIHPNIIAVNENLTHALTRLSSLIKNKDEKHSLLNRALRIYNSTLSESKNKFVIQGWGNALTLLAEISDVNDRDGIFSEAHKKYDLATTLDAKDPKAYYNWGLSYYKHSQFFNEDEKARLLDKAIEKYNQALVLDPVYVDALVNNAVALKDYALLKNKNEQENLFKQIFKMYEKIVHIKKDYIILNNWGFVLAKYAGLISDKNSKTKIYNKAYKKYQESININQENYQTYDNWGVAKLDHAKYINTNENLELIHEAIGLFHSAERIKSGVSAYNLACAYLLLDDKDRAKKWLLLGSDMNTLPGCDVFLKDNDLNSLRDEKWFKDLIQEICN